MVEESLAGAIGEVVVVPGVAELVDEEQREPVTDRDGRRSVSGLGSE